MVPDLDIFETRVALGRPGEAEDPGWIRDLWISWENLLVAMDTCHYHGRGQILTTTATYIVI